MKRRKPVRVTGYSPVTVLVRNLQGGKLSYGELPHGVLYY
jgi:hypothetical protein